VQNNGRLQVIINISLLVGTALMSMLAIWAWTSKYNTYVLLHCLFWKKKKEGGFLDLCDIDMAVYHLLCVCK
jgi:hypothetical protein